MNKQFLENLNLNELNNLVEISFKNYKIMDKIEQEFIRRYEIIRGLKLK